MKNKGFTLIETLLALFLAAILITILSVVFNTGLRAYRQGKDLLNITRSTQLLLGQMTRELPGAMVQSSGGIVYIPFEGSSHSVFFMAPVDNASELDLCEIGYLLEENIIKRHFVTYESYPDPFEYSAPRKTVDYTTGQRNPFCSNITAFNLRYKNGNTWLKTWTDTSKLPSLVEIQITIEGEYPKSGPKQDKTFTTWIYLPNSTNNP